MESALQIKVNDVQRTSKEDTKIERSKTTNKKEITRRDNQYIRPSVKIKKASIKFKIKIKIG